MGKFYKDLKAGLEEVLAYKQGKVKLTPEPVNLPKPPSKYKSKAIKKIRENKKYSQDFFARALNVSTKTVQAWESGKSNPNHTALRLLEIIDKGIYRP